MNDMKISGLPEAGTIGGDELIPLVQAGETRRINAGDLVPAKASLDDLKVGTDDSKFTTSSGLTGWWNWIKGQALSLAGNVTLNGVNNTAPNQIGVQPDNSTLVNLSQIRDFISSTFRERYSPLTAMPYKVSAGGSPAYGDCLSRWFDGSTVGDYWQQDLLWDVGSIGALGQGTDFRVPRRLKIMLHGALRGQAGVPFSRFVCQLGRSTSDNSPDYLASKGIGFEVIFDGASYMARLFWHDGTSLQFGTFSSVPDFSGNVVSMVLEGDGNGKLTLYYASTNMYEPTWPLVKVAEETNTVTGVAAIGMCKWESFLRIEQSITNGCAMEIRAAACEENFNQ